jgi:long-chain acyl-CoA synthetase
VSKGAMLTHGNLLANLEQAFAMGKSHIVDGKEVVLTALPLYHIFAFTFNLLSFYAVGARNILVPSPRPIGNLQRALENYNVTWISGVNTLFNALLNEEWFSLFPPKHLKAAVAGGAALQHAVAERWQKITGTRIAEGYGLTESSPVVSFNPISGVQKPDSIGIPVPGTNVRLVDDAGKPVAPGEPGELIVNGPQVMQGYWNKPEETAKTIKDGWLYSGDLGYRADGNVFVCGRVKDLIIVNGANHYPQDIEWVVGDLEGVRRGNVVAFSVMKDGLEALVIAAEGNSGDAARLKTDIARVVSETFGLTPAHVAICPVGALPKTSSGKAQRRKSKAMWESKELEEHP